MPYVVIQQIKYVLLYNGKVQTSKKIEKENIDINSLVGELKSANDEI